MAVVALTDAVVHVDGYNFTTDINQVGIEVTAAELDSTTFGSSWRTVVGGVKSVDFNMAGFWQSAASAAVDPEVFPNMGTADRVMTAAHGSTEGSVAYLFQATQLNYSLLGSHGELVPFSVTAAGSNGAGVARGYLAVSEEAVAATGAIGAEPQMGAVSASETLYAALHVFDIDGATITAVVESDDNSGFSSATTRATFSAIDANGGTWQSAAGAITDDYWRVRVTSLSGGNPTISVSFGIGAS